MSKRRRRGRGGGGRGSSAAAARPVSPRRAFWGSTRPPAEGTTTAAAKPKPIRATPDPAALLRSLGNPPLSPASAPHHLAVVYEEAVRAATALAAANGLLADDGEH